MKNNSQAPSWDETEEIKEVPKFEETTDIEEVGAVSEVKPEREKASKLKSGALGAVQGATLGFADEGEALIRSLSPNATYEDALKAVRERYKLAEQDNPGTYLAGNVGGGVATMFVPGLNVAKGATMAGQMGRAALAGGIAGLGNSEADLTKGEIGQAGMDIATGAGLGAVSVPAGQMIGKGMQKAGTGLQSVFKSNAEEQAVKNLGFGKKLFENLNQQGESGRKINDLGRILLDEDALRINTEAQAEALKNLSKGLGGEIGEAYSKVGDVSMDDAFRGMMSRAKNQSTDLFTDEVMRYRNAAGGIMDDAMRPASDVRGAISQLDDKIYSPATFSEKPNQEAAKIARRALDESFNKQALNDLGQEAFDEMSKKQNAYGLIQTGKKLTENQLSSEVGASPFSLSNLLTVGSGYSAGGPIGALATYGAKKAYDKGGNYVAAKTLDAASKSMGHINKIAQSPAMGKFSQVLRDAASRGEQALSATHYTLYKSDPEYRALYDETEALEGEE